MPIKWLFQSTGIKLATFAEQVAVANSLGFNYTEFGVISETNTISNIENIWSSLEDDYIVRGGTKMLQILDKIKHPSELNQFLTPAQLESASYFIDKLRKGIFYDVKTFDQAFYNELGLPLLNNNARVYSFEEMNNISFDSDMFIKPSRDLKAFEAGILPANATLAEYLRQTWSTNFVQEENVIVAPVQKIAVEYRFFIVGDKVSTGSIYKVGDHVNPMPIPVNDHVWDIASEWGRLYQPHDIFTMDIAKTESGKYAIVEYNCWNASGLYKSDIAKLFCDVKNRVLELNSEQYPDITYS